jgi:serine protease Do
MKVLRPKQIVYALAVVAGVSGVASLYQTRVEALPAAPVAQTAPVAMLALPDFTGLVQRNAPAVVNITVKGEAREAGPDLPDAFRDFFPDMPQPREMPRRSEGLGSGFIISPDGYILTNHHVVNGAREIRVRLEDKREYVAKLVGSDKLSDVALLKIDASNLPTVALGDPAQLKVGQWVLAIGAPFGLERTATQGIVSALRRTLPDDTYVPFIQTDVPINPGNSGGPLFDLSGRVIGINSQIYSRTGGYMGLSFAIPINVGMDVAKQLMAGKSITRGWLGISLQEVTYDLAQSFGLPQPVGALVADVSPGSPAARAGIKAGDIITAYGAQTIRDSGDLPPLVGMSQPGNAVDIKILRAGNAQTLSVTVGKLAGRENLARAQGDSSDPDTGRLNLGVRDLEPREASQLGLKGGVAVEEIGPGAAADAGVRPGDVVLAVNQQPVHDVKQLTKIVHGLPSDRPVPIQIRRDDQVLFLALKLAPPRG